MSTIEKYSTEPLVATGLHGEGKSKRANKHQVSVIDSSNGSHCLSLPVLLSLLIDVLPHLRSGDELLFHIGALALGVGKHCDELFIVQQIPCVFAQTHKKHLVQSKQCLSIASDLLKYILQRFL